jgi:hypothetical protein
MLFTANSVWLTFVTVSENTACGVCNNVTCTVANLRHTATALFYLCTHDTCSINPHGQSFIILEARDTQLASRFACLINWSAIVSEMSVS